ncbi:MAG: AraC family transcriptional regulator [Lachnospiraceae bacterium]|nr:AraC family transcriptional regulator [Lachnospiraceae bacterium]
MITNETINQAIDFILQHIEEELTLEDVASHCHFSKYYFSRLFKEQTGESVYGFIKRVKLEQSAFRLKVEQSRPITEISADYGYSSSNYSSAFKQHYQMAPIVFRKGSRRHSMEHPFFHHEQWQVESFEECDEKITIEEIPDYHVIYERRFGSYENMSADWNRFIERYREYITEDTKFLERTYDDPAVTCLENCLYDIGMSVDKSCPLENIVRIQGGRCIVYHFKGHAKHIYAAYQTIFLVWLPKTSYEMDAGRSLFDIYHLVDCDTMYMELDICVPIKRR